MTDLRPSKAKCPECGSYWMGGTCPVHGVFDEDLLVQRAWKGLNPEKRVGAIFMALNSRSIDSHSVLTEIVAYDWNTGLDVPHKVPVWFADMLLIIRNAFHVSAETVLGHSLQAHLSNMVSGLWCLLNLGGHSSEFRSLVGEQQILDSMLLLLEPYRGESEAK